MPNLPTSLILVLLAVAWLWVLVPMFARSREAVPETDDNAVGFRVLRRAGSRLRRPALQRRRSADEEDDFVADEQDGELVESLVDGDNLDGDYADESGDETVAARDSNAWHYDNAEHYDAAQYEDSAEWVRDDVAPGSTPMSAPGRGRRTEPQHRSELSGHRPGRGGFDPEHDVAAAAFRYRRRRFVTLIMVLLIGGMAAGALLGVSSSLWIGVTGASLLLVGYLAYLSRQVRIERDISARRRARMQRARQIRPIAPLPAEPVSPYESQQAPAGRPVARRSQPHDRPAPHSPPPAARYSQVPPMHRGIGTVVDLDDDDPAFDDLDHYEPVVYRRAAGQ